MLRWIVATERRRNRDRSGSLPVAVKARVWMAVLAAVVLARSAVFVFWPGAHFDSDQAVTGLMGRHLAHLRAFPVFWYGQTYMLGVEAWLAAAVMAVFGSSVTALKLPLLAMNVAVALLLFRGLTRDTGLDDRSAAFATLFFVLAAPMTAAHVLTANGGNVEPLLYVLLLWFLRSRPWWMGIVLGIGFLNREFTLYGAVALVVLDAFVGGLFTRARAAHYAKVFGVAAAVWIVVLVLRGFSSAAGPGTSVADLSTQLASNNLAQIAERLCLDPRAIASGIGRIFTVHWPELFGLERQPLTDFGIESAAVQGFPGAAWLLLPVLGIPLVRLARIRGRGGRYPTTFCAYLVLTAALSLSGYLIGRCGVVDFYTMRYELLSIAGAVGLSGWFLAREPSRIVRAVWALSAAAIFAVAVFGHVRLLGEYATHPPVPAKQALIEALEARGVRYAYADYWTAYYVTFMTRERIIVASDSVVKVRTHNREVDAHRAEAVRIARRPCDGGEQLTPAFWACRP